jgi:hypothetical protein
VNIYIAVYIVQYLNISSCNIIRLIMHNAMIYSSQVMICSASWTEMSMLLNILYIFREQSTALIYF